MMTISDLPTELIEEILYRVSLTSLNSVRLTCRTWNAFSKKHILGKKAARIKNQFPEFLNVDCSIRFDLQGILNKVDPNNQVELRQVFHCDGLLLCVTKDRSRLLLCNPYLGQIKWIQVPWRDDLYSEVDYTLGYDSNRNHKIIRYFYGGHYDEFIIVYDFCSESWSHLFTPDDIMLRLGGVSVKGNAYFIGQEMTRVEGIVKLEDYIRCFDLTTEQFGPNLPLPFTPEYSDYYPSFALCSVRDEKLAVLYTHKETCEKIGIWITTKIEPNAVSWMVFVKLDFRLINGLPDDFSIYVRSTGFFIDEEEKKVALLFDRRDYYKPRNDQMAYIVGENGYFKSVNMGKALSTMYHLGYSSYVPSLVQLKERDE